MTYEEAVKREAEKPNGTIRLLLWNGFYRAYNESAYYFHTCIAQHKVTRKHVEKLKQEVYYTGFPVDKLIDRMGGREHTKTEFGYDVVLKPEELPSLDGYEGWKGTVPTEPASRGDCNLLPLGGDELCRVVCAKIRAFPMESKTLIESVAFLGELKYMLSDVRGK